MIILEDNLVVSREKIKWERSLVFIDMMAKKVKLTAKGAWREGVREKLLWGKQTTKKTKPTQQTNKGSKR